MKEIEKLIEIKKRTGISYEMMARKMGVSFQTILRWINKGDKPGSLAMAQIERFIKEDWREHRKENAEL